MAVGMAGSVVALANFEATTRRGPDPARWVLRTMSARGTALGVPRHCKLHRRRVRVSRTARVAPRFAAVVVGHVRGLPSMQLWELAPVSWSRMPCSWRWPRHGT